jgi:hypothetical protein
MKKKQTDWTELEQLIQKLVSEKNLAQQESEEHQKMLAHIFKLTEWEKHPSQQ